MSNISTYLILCLLILITATGIGQVQASESFFLSNATLQVIESDSSDNLETNSSPDKGQTKVALPHRLAATEFQHQKQLTPNYEVVVEFLAEDFCAKHFVYIRTIPDLQPWFELAAFVPNKSRLSGWKNSRPLHPFSYTEFTPS